MLQYKDLTTPFKVDQYGMDINGTTGLMQTDGVELCSDKTLQFNPATGAYQRCYGHNPYDVTFFRSTHKTEEGAWVQTHLTNWEVRQSQMVKGTYGLPYLYNHYEFDHCAEIGVTFKSVEDADEILGDDE